MSEKWLKSCLMLIIVCASISRGAGMQSTMASCPTPLIFEFINGFKLPANDISLLLANQFSHNTLQNINAPNKVYLTNIVYQSRLLSQDQSESYPTPLSVIVYNDKIQFEIDYKILITQGAVVPKNQTFIAKTKISNIMISYQKNYVLENSSLLITNVNVKLQASMFKTTYDKEPKDKQLQSFNTAILGSTNSLFATFTNLLTVNDVSRYMQSNIKKQPISSVYQENPYNYKFDNGDKVTITIPIDMTTIWYNATSSTEFTNGMNGLFPSGNNYCSNFIPNFNQHGGQLFITKQLIQNFIDYNLIAFTGWQQLKIDQSTVRSNILQWQLLDLDYLIDGLWTDLYMVTENEIYFLCSAKENLGTQLINNKGPKIHQTLKWGCNGYVKLNSTFQQKVIQFYPTIDHITDISVTSGSITPYVNVLQLIDCEFKDVPAMSGQGVYKLNQKNLKLAYQFIQSVFNDFRTYPVGHRFFLGNQATKIQVEDQGKGLWIL